MRLRRPPANGWGFEFIEGFCREEGGISAEGSAEEGGISAEGSAEEGGIAPEGSEEEEFIRGGIIGPRRVFTTGDDRGGSDEGRDKDGGRGSDDKSCSGGG